MVTAASPAIDLRAFGGSALVGDGDIPPNGRDQSTFIAKQVLDIGVYGIVWPHVSTVEEARNAVTAAHPRPDFKRRILQAFTDANVHRPETTFGTVNADVVIRATEGYTAALPGLKRMVGARSLWGGCKELLKLEQRDYAETVRDEDPRPAPVPRNALA